MEITDPAAIKAPNNRASRHGCPSHRCETTAAQPEKSSARPAITERRIHRECIRPAVRRSFVMTNHYPERTVRVRDSRHL
ncbi:hypothetical protein AB0K74_35570 [Streptomyces sp. NPDC056159]|uniref:hypothetical protein n=1 Tax=Streptomyces sp. NPDC056159 TaxID=3155537 RepID=UPI00344A3524